MQHFLSSSLIHKTFKIVGFILDFIINLNFKVSWFSMTSFPLEHWKVESFLFSPNQWPLFDHMTVIWTNDRTGFDGKFHSKAPPFWYFIAWLNTVYCIQTFIFHSFIKETCKLSFMIVSYKTYKIVILPGYIPPPPMLHSNFCFCTC